MSLYWETVHAGLQMTLAQNGYEYRIRETDGGVTLYQEHRRTRQVEQRKFCRDHIEAYALAERWARDVALLKGVTGVTV